MNEGISREEAANIALAAAKEAVRQSHSELFAILGVNPSNQESLNTLREDMIWVRRTRKMSDSIGSKLTLAFVGIIAVSIGIALWEGFQSLLNK